MAIMGTLHKDAHVFLHTEVIVMGKPEATVVTMVEKSPLTQTTLTSLVPFAKVRFW
jgi:hypothetical protein